MNFFFTWLLNIKTQQRYIDIILLRIFHLSRANIHINKCYFAKSYSAKCCKEKIRNILGIGLCVKLFCRTSIVSQMICGLSYITSYILNEDRKHAKFMSHTPTCIVTGQYIILLRQYSGFGSRTDLENSAYKLTIIIHIWEIHGNILSMNIV